MKKIFAATLSVAAISTCLDSALAADVSCFTDTPLIRAVQHGDDYIVEGGLVRKGKFSLLIRENTNVAQPVAEGVRTTRELLKKRLLDLPEVQYSSLQCSNAMSKCVLDGSLNSNDGVYPIGLLVQ